MPATLTVSWLVWTHMTLNTYFFLIMIFMSSQSLLACLTIMCWYCIILQAARILVQLMCKHEYDARYQALDDKLYIAQQYFPLVGLVSFVEFSDSDSTFSVIRTYRQNVMLILVGTGFCSCARNFLQGFVPFHVYPTTRWSLWQLPLCLG